MKSLFLVTTLLLIVTNAFSKQTDSLIAALKTADNDSKLIIYRELCIAYYSIDLDSAGLFAQERLDLARSQKDIEQQTISLNLIGNVHNIKGEFDLAIEYYQKALKFALKHELKSHIGVIINNIGTVHEYLGDYDKSLRYYKQALHMDSTNSNLTGIGTALPNIGNIHLRKSNYAKAIHYFKKGLTVAEDLNDNDGIIIAYNSLGMTYSKISDFKKASEYYLLALKKTEQLEDFYNMSFILINLGSLYNDWDNNSKALEFYKRSRLISEKISNFPNLVNALTDIGVIFNKMNKPDSAITMFSLALEKSKLVNDPYIISSTNFNIGNSYVLKKNYTKAKEYYTKSFISREKLGNPDDIASALNSLGKISYLTKDYKTAIAYITRSNKLVVSAITKIKNYQLLSDIYSKLNKPNKALSYYILYSEMRDSTFSSEKHKQIQELQTKYEVEKKEQTIVALSKEKEIEVLKNKQSSYYIISLLAVLVIFVFVGILIFRNSRLNARRNTIELEQKLLRSQMNPHFIFNAISCIQGYIMGKKPIEAGSYLSKFAKLMRSILSNSATELISIDDEIETLENYLQLQKMRFPQKLEYEIIVAGDMETDELAIPPMLSQPFIENAIKHGIEKKNNGRGKVTVEFSENNDGLLLTIHDNGIGIKAFDEQKDKKHESMATKITESRIANFKKAYKKEVHFEVGNILNKRSEVEGVEVLFRLPKAYLVQN